MLKLLYFSVVQSHFVTWNWSSWKYMQFIFKQIQNTQ